MARADAKSELSGYTVKKHLLSDGANAETGNGKAAYSNILDQSITPETIKKKGGHYGKCKPEEKVKEDTDKEHYYKLAYENTVGGFVKNGYYDSTRQHHGAVHFVEKFFKKYQVYSQVYSYSVTNAKSKTVDYYYFIYIWRELVDDDYHKATDKDYLTYCIQYGASISKSDAAYAKEKKVYDKLSENQQYKLACAIYYGPHQAADGTYYSTLDEKLPDSIQCFDTSTWTKTLFLRYCATQFYIWTITNPSKFSYADAKNTAKQFDSDYKTSNESCYDFLIALAKYVDTATKVPSFMKDSREEAQKSVVSLRKKGELYTKVLTDSRGMLKTGTVSCENSKVTVTVDSASQLTLTAAEPVESAEITFTKKQKVPSSKLGLLYYANEKAQDMVKPVANTTSFSAYLDIHTVENHPEEGMLSVCKRDEETKEVLQGAVYQVLTTLKTAAIYNPETHAAMKDPKTGKTIDAADYIAGYLYNDGNGYKLIPYTAENKAWLDSQKVLSCKTAYNVAYYSDGAKGYRIETDGNGEVSTKPLLRKKTVGTGEQQETTWYSYYLIEVKAPEHFELPYTVTFGADGRLLTGQVCLKQNLGQTTWPEYELQLNHTNHEIPGGLEIYKTDAKTLRPLKDVVFHVYSDSDCQSLVAELITDTEGKASLAGLHSGEYYVQEISEINGYIKTENLKMVTVESGKTTRVEFENMPVIVHIDIQKKLSEEAAGKLEEAQLAKAKKFSLADAEYELHAGGDIYGANGELLYRKDDCIYTLVTDAEGKASVPVEFADEHLRKGEYYVVETAAPRGFLLNSEPVVVKADSLENPQDSEEVDEYTKGNIIYCSVTMPEAPRLFHISIRKEQKGIESEKIMSEPLAGAQFSVFDLDLMQEDGISVNEGKIKDFDFLSGDYDMYRVKISPDKENPYVVQTERDGTAALAVTEGLVLGRYAVVETAAPYGYHLAEPQIVDLNRAEDEKAEIVQVTFTDIRKTGNIEVFKTGDTLTGCTLEETEYGPLYHPVFQQKPLQGVEFAIYDENMALVDTLITDQGGHGISKELYFGTYFIKETKTAPGLALEQELYKAVISEDKNHVQVNPRVEFQNNRTQLRLSVYKQGEGMAAGDGAFFSFETKPLEGVAFGIYNNKPLSDKNGGVIIPAHSLLGIAETDSTGRALFEPELVPGDYYYKELKTLSCYIRDEGQYPFTLTMDSGTKLEEMDLNKEAPLVNRFYKAGVRLHKVDATNHEKGLPEVKFGLYRSDTDELMGIYETDANGEIYVEKVPYGQWYFKELESVRGYQIDVLRHEFQVDERQEEVTLLVENQPELSLSYEDENDWIYCIAELAFAVMLAYAAMVWRGRCKR